MYELLEMLVQFVEFLGYPGLFLMTFVESTFVPIPSEITLIPAGYLVQKGQLNFYMVWLVSVLGTLGGSLFNYYIAFHFGRRFLVKYGKYMFMKPETLKNIEVFFEKHGAISLFTGRLLPGIKHFISFPAGLAGMNFKTFSLYTLIGAVIWCYLLIYIGYLVGENDSLISEYVRNVKGLLIIFVLLLVTVYYFIKRKTSV
jgi:membrane protein DedA with SNARE-associated domain